MHRKTNDNGNINYVAASSFEAQLEHARKHPDRTVIIQDIPAGTRPLNTYNIPPNCIVLADLSADSSSTLYNPENKIAIKTKLDGLTGKFAWSVYKDKDNTTVALLSLENVSQDARTRLILSLDLLKTNAVVSKIEVTRFAGTLKDVLVLRTVDFLLLNKVESLDAAPAEKHTTYYGAH